MAEPRPIVWETVDLLPDCAQAGLGDPSLVRDDSWVAEVRPEVHLRRSGLGMMHGSAQCDGLPVEIGRVGSEVVAARIEFVNDVAQVERRGGGRWVTLSRLRIGRRGAVALDTNRADNPRWRTRLPLAAGWYRAQAFETQKDRIGIRLISERYQEPSSK